jgi:hypothetical protein
MAEAQRGLYRQAAIGDDEAFAYVLSNEAAMFVTESEYRAEAMSPPFETLHSQEEYEAAADRADIEAKKDVDVAARDRFD